MHRIYFLGGGRGILLNIDDVRFWMVRWKTSTSPPPKKKKWEGSRGRAKFAPPPPTPLHIPRARCNNTRRISSKLVEVLNFQTRRTSSKLIGSLSWLKNRRVSTILKMEFLRQVSTGFEEYRQVSTRFWQFETRRKSSIFYLGNSLWQAVISSRASCRVVTITDAPYRSLRNWLGFRLLIHTLSE